MKCSSICKEISGSTFYWGGVDEVLLTESMKSKAREAESVGWMRLMIPSHGDLLLMKLLAGRDKDLDDAITLARTGGMGSWKTLASEFIKQLSLSSKPKKLLSRVNESHTRWRNMLRSPPAVGQLMEELNRAVFEPPKKLVLIRSQRPMDMWERELENTLKLLDDVERLGILVEKVEIKQEEKERKYLELAVPASVLRKYGIRRILGTGRYPGSLFGDVPALVVYRGSLKFVDDIYPHELLSTVRFLPSDYLRILVNVLRTTRSPAGLTHR